MIWDVARRGVLTLLLVAGAEAGETLSVRLVKADQTGKPSDPGLADVLPALTQSLAFRTYAVVASTTVPIPVSPQELRLGPYRVGCSGPPDNLSIQIRQDHTPLLYTTISLKPGKPVIVGGFPVADGRMIFVFLLSR